MFQKYDMQLIRNKAEELGFKLIRLYEDSKPPTVELECKKGHKNTGSIYKLNNGNIQCRICNGNRYDVEKAKKLLALEGYRFKEEPKKEYDRYGNIVVKANTRFKAICPEGHTQSVNITEFSKGKRCTTCSGTILNSGFSRSEEIIARILDVANVNYKRQVPTSEEYGSLPLDFYLPQQRIIIEYDGEHHKYGRSESTDEQIKDIKQKDKIRDKYAESIGFTMVRIPDTSAGKVLVYELSSLLKTYGVEIGEDDHLYDEIMAEVFNYCASRFGWLTYAEIKETADVYLSTTGKEASEITGLSITVMARRFRWIYGMNKEDFLKRKN